MYYIKHNDLYYVCANSWAKKDSPFYRPKQFTHKDAVKVIALMKDKNPTEVYTLERV